MKRSGLETESLTEQKPALQDYATVVDILGRLLQAPIDSANTAIHRALQQMGIQTGVDRAYVFCLRDADLMDNTHEWTAVGIEPMIDQLQGMSQQIISHWRNSFERGDLAYIADVDHLDDDAPEKAILQIQGVQSILVVPIMNEGIFSGLVGYDTVNQRRGFADHEISLLSSVAAGIGSIIARRRAEENRREARRDLEAARSRLSATLDAMPDLVLEVDSTGRYSGYHTGVPDLLVQRPEDLIGTTLEESLPPEAATIVRLAMRQTDERGQSAGHRYFLDSSKGPRCFQLSAARRAPDQPGQAHGYVFVIRDITEEFHQREMLDRLGEVVRHMTNLVVIVGTD
ncbi:MAG: PAS domain-containing protein, partial [Gemmobacter sp.]|nr:PAS domain-containing protein [Gemmobacter sp.]